MQRIFIDFETYYDKEYSLTTMTTIEYILDPRFKVLGTAIIVEGSPAVWYDGEKLPDLDWGIMEVIAHNNYFDAMVLVLHYGIRAKRWGDTLSMARAVMPIKSHKLALIAPLLKIGEKGEGLTLGAEESDEKLIDYALQDVLLCQGIYMKLLPMFPEDELNLIHLTIRWGVDPTLVLDLRKLDDTLLVAQGERALAIIKSGLTEEVLASNKQFERWMINEGIEVPLKPSPSGNDYMIPAFGKNDPEFHKTQANNPQYEHVWKAREAVKSNITISRTKTLIDIANCSPTHIVPMPLKYCGAHTMRWSGHEINVQNMPRGSEMRKSFRAPEGHVVVVADSSQIELRVNAWYANEMYVFDVLRKGEDIYKVTATKIFGVDYDKVTKDQRSVAKACVLGAGYGMGIPKYKDYMASGPLGMAPMFLTDDEATIAITGYRDANPKIVANWKLHDKALAIMAADPRNKRNTRPTSLTIGPAEFARKAVKMPNGMSLLYSGLTAAHDGYRYGIAGIETHTYGAKLVENVVQCLARIIIGEQLLECERRGIHTVSTTHDEIIAVCRADEAQQVHDTMIEIMSTPPQWAQGLELGAEGGWDECYSK